jgi:phage terminase small subunit
MGRGGERPGAGRKPGAQDGVVLKMADRRTDVPAASPSLDEAERQGLLEPPDGLTDGAQAFWKLTAAQALAERTLTPATAAGFRQCCQQWAYLGELDKKIQHLGADTKEAGAYFVTYLKLAQRLDNSLARFKLTAFGKSAVRDKPKVAANPWASVVAK